MFDQIRQGTCACFVYMSQQIAAPEQLQLDNRKLARENQKLAQALQARDKEVAKLTERGQTLEVTLCELKEVQESLEREFD